MLAVILALTITSTAIHYTHNYVAASDYPPVFPFVNDLAYRIGIAIFLPLGTISAIMAYRMYAAGQRAAPQRMLAGYSLLGLTSIGHFLGGVPDVPPFFFATIFTDFLTGSAVLAFVIWSVRSDTP